MPVRLHFAFVLCIWFFAGRASAQNIGAKSAYPVVTVCESLRNRLELNGKRVIVVGKLVYTGEGAWLDEDCNQKIAAEGGTWTFANAISLTYVLGRVDEPPLLPVRFKWDMQVLKTKLQQVQRTTKLQTLKKYHYSDSWVAVFGRFETREPLTAGAGCGHMNAAAAQLIAAGNAYRELKPD